MENRGWKLDHVSIFHDLVLNVAHFIHFFNCRAWWNSWRRTASQRWLCSMHPGVAFASEWNPTTRRRQLNSRARPHWPPSMSTDPKTPRCGSSTTLLGSPRWSTSSEHFFQFSLSKAPVSWNSLGFCDKDCHIQVVLFKLNERAEPNEALFEIRWSILSLGLLYFFPLWILYAIVHSKT